MAQDMTFTNLGGTGLRVSRICVGCLSYGMADGRWSWSLPEEQALPLLNYAYEKKINFFDTANVYSNGVSEQILGKAIKKYNWRRDNIVIATKLCIPVGDGKVDAMSLSRDERDNQGYVNMYGLSRKHIFESIDASLKRLDLPYVDLLQIHRADRHTSPKETMEALHDVVKSGKVRYIGASSMRAHQLLEYQYTARLHGYTEFVSMQNLYNAIYREEEHEMFPSCAKFKMGGIPWGPVAQGFLTRPYETPSGTARGANVDNGFFGVPWTDADKAINKRIQEIAKARDTTMAIVAIAYVLSKPFIDAPILGLSSEKRIDEAVEATRFQLSEAEIKSIEDLYEPKKVMGLFE